MRLRTDQTLSNRFDWFTVVDSLFKPSYSAHPKYDEWKDNAKKSKSAVTFYPLNIINSINDCIDKSMSYSEIVSFIKEKYAAAYPGILESTTPDAVKTYMKRYNEIKIYVEKLKSYSGDKNIQKLQETVTEGEKSLERILTSKDPAKISRGQAMYSLLMKCITRFKEVEDAQIAQTCLNPKLEKVLLDYIEQMKDLILKMASLIDEPSDEQAIIMVVRGELSDILEAVKQVVLDVCPNDYEVVIKKLKMKLTEKGIFMSKKTTDDGHKETS